MKLFAKIAEAFERAREFSFSQNLYPRFRTNLSFPPQAGECFTLRNNNESEREVSDAYIDVNQRLIWSSSKFHRKRMIVFAVGVIAAAVIVWLGSERERWVFGIAGAVFFAFAFYDIYKMMDPKSALVELLPEGIIFRTTSEDFIVPWSEIRAVDTIDINTSFNGRAESYQGVTAVLVSKHFYDRVIYIDTLFMRGPGWNAHFVPKNDNEIFLALHHEIIPAPAAEIRRQVESRWRAFGTATPKQ